MSVSVVGDRQVAGVPGDLWIGGQFRSGSAGAKIAVFDPSDGTPIGYVADACIEDAILAVDSCDNAASQWAAKAPRQRAEILRRCFDIMTARADEFAHLISRENGKALRDAKGEVAYAAEFFRWFSEEAVRIKGNISMAPSGANRIIVDHQPIGISVLITPWNFPAAMATRKLAPALAAGCTCILKPATETPLTAYALAQLLADAGVPDGVVNVITTSKAGPVVGAMLHDPRVRKLSFTGSTPVGRSLLREAADQVISCSMELGGNAPFIVFDDADIEVALNGAMIAKMRNAGEACTAANRFYVHTDVLDAFSEGLAKRMAALKIGPGTDVETECGPMINTDAVARIDGLVLDAVDKGATVLTGGKVHESKGCFYLPTVLADVPPDARLLHEEIFGPIAPIVAFDNEDEVVAMANNTEFGLISYVFTSDLARGLRMSEKLESGMIGLNRGLVSDPASPFGGTKQSGLGREGADHGIKEFLEAKYIATQW